MNVDALKQDRLALAKRIAYLKAAVQENLTRARRVKFELQERKAYKQQ